MLNYKNEISRTPPSDVPERSFDCGTPLFYCFDCALCEQETETGYDYYAVNCYTGNRLRISRRKFPMATYEDVKFAELVHRSALAGASRYQIDRPAGQGISLAKSKQLLRYILGVILPQCGYATTAEQVKYGELILEAISRQETILVEAGDGFEQSLPYLIAIIITKRGRLNDQANLSLYPEMQYADMFKLPSIVSMPNVAQQKEIASDWIPALSRILLDREMILTPLTAIHRRGREHFVCQRNLRVHLSREKNQDMRKALVILLHQGAADDFTGAKDLPLNTMKKICAPKYCDSACRYREVCRFATYRKAAHSYDFDFQVCGHGHILNDGQERFIGRPTFVPNHQLILISQKHLLENAEKVYAEEISNQTAQQIMDLVGAQKYHRKGSRNLASIASRKLRNVNNKLFSALTISVEQVEKCEAVVLDNEATRQLNNITDISDRLIGILRNEVFYRKAEAIITWARERYKANLSRVDIGRLLAKTSNTDSELRKQAILLHRAICEQPGIAVHIANEASDRREPRFGINPEQYALHRERSSVKDKIWRRIEKLMLSENMRCVGCDIFYDLIWTLGQLRDCSAYLAQNCEWNYALDVKDGETLLCATPKNLPERLSRDLWSRKIPIMLISEEPASTNDTEYIKSALGLDIK